MGFIVPSICTLRNTQTSARARERISRLMDCRKLSPDACTHAVQNERLPMRVVVQVLFFDQNRVAMSSLTDPSESYGSSRSAEEDWDSVPTAEEVRALAALRLSNTVGAKSKSNGVKGLVMSNRIFSKMWSSKGENSCSETSASMSGEETKSTSSRSRRHS